MYSAQLLNKTYIIGSILGLLVWGKSQEQPPWPRLPSLQVFFRSPSTGVDCCGQACSEHPSQSECSWLTEWLFIFGDPKESLNVRIVMWKLKCSFSWKFSGSLNLNLAPLPQRRRAPGLRRSAAWRAGIKVYLSLNVISGHHYWKLTMGVRWPVGVKWSFTAMLLDFGATATIHENPPPRWTPSP